MILDGLLGRRSFTRQPVPLSHPSVAEYLGARPSRSGAVVSARSALGSSPVWQAVTLLMGDTAKLDWKTYQKMIPRGRREAVGHDTYNMLLYHTGETTTNIWVQCMMSNALLYGNAYSRIELDAVGQPIGMELAHPDRVQNLRDQGGTGFQVTPEHGVGDDRYWSEEETFHLRGLTFDFWDGLSLIEYARDVFGRNLSIERYGDDFFNGQAVPSGFFKHPGDLGGIENQKRFLQAYQARHTGEGDRFRAGFLPEGMDWMAAGVSPEDALLVDQLKFSVIDVARLFNLPPHKLGDSTKVAYKSIEEENRSYHDSSLGVWLNRLEREADDKCFSRAERDSRRYFTRFDRSPLYRPTFAEAMTGYSKAITYGILTRNEVRDELMRNPIEGGDEPVLALNVGPADADDGQPSPSSGDSAGSSSRDKPRTRIREALVSTLADRASYVLKWVSDRSAKSDNFLALVNDLDDRHGRFVEDRLCPLAGIISAEYETESDVSESGRRVLISALTEELLKAAECQPDQLADRVRDVQRSVTAISERVATQLLEAIEQDG